MTVLLAEYFLIIIILAYINLIVTTLKIKNNVD
jgi:hypothetical protein